jgi:hypothetical protein
MLTESLAFSFIREGCYKQVTIALKLHIADNNLPSTTQRAVIGITAIFTSRVYRVSRYDWLSMSWMHTSRIMKALISGSVCMKMERFS